MDDLVEAGASMKRSRRAHELEPGSSKRRQLEHQLIYTCRKIIILTNDFLAALLLLWLLLFDSLPLVASVCR